MTRLTRCILRQNVAELYSMREPHNTCFLRRSLREVKDAWRRNPDCPGAHNVLKHLRIINDYATKASKKRSRALRNNASAMILSCIDKIVVRYADDPILKKFRGKINNVDSYLF